MNDSYVDINEIYESRKIWVPMDCFLTLSVAGLYFVEIKYDKCDHKDDICNFSAKEKLLEGMEEDVPWGQQDNDVNLRNLNFASSAPKIKP